MSENKNNNNINNNTLSTISVENEKEKTRRHSHQLKTTTNSGIPKVRRNNSIENVSLVQNENVVRRSNSVGKNKRSAQTSSLQIPSVPDIPEVEQNEDDTGSIKTDITRKDSKLNSNRKYSSQRSQSNRSFKISIDNNNKGYTNDAYDQSNGTSLNGSMASLPVIREQYCCCKKWTKMEKILLAIVAVLGVVIVGLIIALGVIGKRSSSDPKSNFWNPLKF